MIVTPLWTTVSSARVRSQLPPRSAARSTITDPGAMASTISVVINFGAGFPGINAVVTMTSLAAVEVLVLGFGVASLVFGILSLERQFDELGAHALDLLLHRRADVVGLDLGAEPPGGGDRLQSGHTGTDDEDACGRDGAGGGHEHREHAWQRGGGEQHTFVARDRC